MRAGRVAAIVAGLVAAALVGAVVVLKSLDFNQYKTLIAEEARKATGRELTIAGDIELEVSFSPALAVSGVSFANAPWGSRPEMARIQRFEAQVELLPLLVGEVRVRRLVLVGVDILLETDENGRGNWLWGGAEAEAGAPPEETAGGGIVVPTFDVVDIRDATLTYRDGKSGEEIRLRLDRLEASAPDLASPLTFELAGGYNGIPFTADGEVGSIQALLGGGAVAVRLDAAIAGAKAHIEGLIAPPDAGETALAINLEGESLADLGPLAGAALPALGPYKLAADLALPPDQLVLTGIEARLGKSDLAGKIRLTFSFPVLVEAELSSRLVDLDAILAATEGGGFSAEAAGESGGKRLFSAEPLPLEALRAFDATVSFRGARITAKGAALEEVALDLELRRGRLRLDPVTARLASGGGIAAEIEIDARKSPASIEIELNARDIDVGALLKALAVTDLIHGKAALEVKLRGRGASVRAIMASLDGHTELEMGKGTIDSKYVDYIALDLLSALAPWGEESENTQVNCLVNRFEIAKGRAVAKTLLFDTARITVAGGGGIDLRDESIDMQLSPRPKDASLVSLAVGINVGGTLAEPTFLPDPASVAKGVAGLAATVVVGPLGLLIPLVSAGSGEENPCVAALARQASAPRAAVAEPEAEEDKSVLDEAKEAVEGIGESIGKALKGLFGGD